MSTDRPANDIAVILPVWNGMDYLPKCLAALRRQQAVSFDLIVVDNASVDGSAGFIEREWPGVQLMRETANLGVAAAYNRALQAAPHYAVYALLHQDTEPLPDWLVHLVEPLRSNPSIGIAGSKALYPNGTIQQAGAQIDSRGVGRPLGARQPDRRQFNAASKAEYVGCVSLAVSREALASAGLMDAAFSPAFYEDADWCYRVRNAGFHVVYAPKSRLIHYTSGITGDEVDPFAYHRNRLRFLLKHWSLHRLVDDFIPAEKNWLATLGARRQTQERSLHRAYMQQLLQLDDIVSAREKSFTDDVEEIHGLAAVLLSLRTLYPAPAGIAGESPSQPQADTSALRRRERLSAYDRFRHSLARLARTPLLAPISEPLVRFSYQQEFAETLIRSLVETSRELTDAAPTSDFPALKRQPPSR